jgi:hypothetical protein
MRRRESGRIAGTLALLVLLAGIGVGAWYFFVYTKSPQYALNQFFAAAKANNTEKVEQYVDKSGGIMSLLFQAALANPSIDPMRALYPGYPDASLGQTQKVQIDSVAVEGDRARVQVTMEVVADGKTETIKPTYVLVKTEEGWKVHVQDTVLGSFNQLVLPRMRQSLQRQLRMVTGTPFAAMVKSQIQSVRAEIEKYPEFAKLLREAGLL